MAQKRILHVLSSVVYRGAENVVCQIIHMFRESPEYQFFYTSPDGVVRESLEEQRVDFHPMKAINPKELKRVIEEVQPTLIHAHDMRASFMAALVSGGIPVINHIHINWADSRTLTPKAFAYYLASHKAKQIFWVSQSAFDGFYFHKQLAHKSVVLQNVIDPDMLREKADRAQLQEEFDILYVGAVVSQKNPAKLGRVLSEVLRRRPQTRCAVVGTGEEVQTLRNALREGGAEEKVKLLGFQRNPYGMLRKAGLMLMTSDFEGTPMSALESLALGTPIVSTPVDGMCDLVDPGENGMLCDSEKALVDACLAITEDAALRQNLSEGAVRKAQQLLRVREYRAEIAKAYEYSL